jgi:hypothetical protein
VASDSRALTLKLLADTADFQKKLEAGSKDVESIGERVAEFGKQAAIAFAAAGAAVGAFAISAVKAAAEDEAAQKQLANTIQATTDATAEQIAGVEKYIEQTSIAIGVTDDQLRPAFARLVRSTKDVEDAQKLLNLALDIASATGRPLESVANALGRAYDGNTTALARLGLGLDANLLKSKDTDKIFQTLTTTFGNFAENEALSTQKQMERVKIALDEAKESIGAALLPVVQELTAWILDNFIPALEAFISGLTGKDGLDGALTDSQKTAVEWGKKVRGFIDTVIELKDEIIIMAGVMAGAFVASKIAAGVQGIIILINGLIKAYNALKASSIVAGVAQAFALNPLLGVGAVALAAAVLSGANALAKDGDTAEVDTGVGGTNLGNRPLGVGSGGSSGGIGGSTGGLTTGLLGAATGSGSSSSGSTATSGKPTTTLIEQVTQENFLKNMAPGYFDPSRVRQFDEGGITINVNSASIIDREGFSRAVVDALNESNARNGGGGSGLRGAIAV